MGYYRTIAAIAALLAMNVLVWYLGIPISENFVFGNHTTESIMIVGLLGFLLDLGVLKNLNNGQIKNYLKIGLIALLFGAAFQILSFASLMYGVQSSYVVLEWFRIAPFTIFLIGIPILYLADKLSYKKKLLHYDVTGIKGIMATAAICFTYTFFVGYLLFFYGYLRVI